MRYLDKTFIVGPKSSDTKYQENWVKIFGKPKEKK